jgi:hypothetical protein
MAPEYSSDDRGITDLEMNNAVRSTPSLAVPTFFLAYFAVIVP